MHIKNTLRFTLVLLSLVLISGTGCKVRQEEPPPPPPLPDNTYSLLVSFYSIGTGVNGNALRLMDEVIREYQEDLKLPVSVEKIPWGREGEVDYCIDLEKLSETQQGEFINKTRQVLKDSQHVHIYENAVCRYKKN